MGAVEVVEDGDGMVEDAGAGVVEDHAKAGGLDLR